MLVYCSNFDLQPQDGFLTVAQSASRWLSRRGFIPPDELLTGIDQRLRDGSHVESMSILANDSDEDDKAYPHFLAIRHSHSDEGGVSGRQWITEIGARLDAEGSTLHCSVLLQTSEISARVTTPIQPTRPWIVDELSRRGNPLSGTPGLSVRQLTAKNARAFLHALEHPNRHAPWIVVSPTKEGHYLIEPQRIRSLVFGLAEVFQIPSNGDTFKIQEEIGSQYSAWLGAINIILPLRHGTSATPFYSIRFLADDLKNISAEGQSPDLQILAAITHRTNLPNSRRHTSMAIVANAKLRRQLFTTIKKAQASDATEYVELLVVADNELKDKEKEVLSLQSELESREAVILKLEAETDGLKHALSGKQASSLSDVTLDTMTSLREAIVATLNGTATLTQSLRLVATLYPERIVVLESAYNSAEESRDFKYPKKATELLKKLATDYWTQLASGKSDSVARQVFGNAYAAKESDSLTTDGHERRTFYLNGQPLEMQRHLKIGVKDSSSETLRIHFEWLASDKKIIVGHCGKHLDF